MSTLGFRHKYRKTKPYRMSTGELRVSVIMDDETYELADRLARESGCTMSAQLRILIDCGIEEFLAASGDKP